MRVIYIDILFGINIIMDYILLFATSRISGIYCNRLKLFIAGIIGGIYAVCTVLTQWFFLSSLFFKLIISCLMVYICFGFTNINHFLKLLVLFISISFAVAGAALAIGNISKTTFFASGGYYIEIPFKTIIFIMIISWVITGFIFRSSAKEKIIKRQTAKANITFKQKTIDLTLLIDTGNNLHDPISGKPVIIIDKISASKILPISSLNILNKLENTADLFLNIPESLKKYFRLVPFHAVGNKGELLLCFKPDKILINGKEWQGLIGINSQPICCGKYEGLIGL